MRLFSPAKINLFLRILGRRPDGYHEIATLMQAINLGDTLTFSLSQKDQFFCDNPQIPADLIFGAVELFRQKTHTQFHVTIQLEKRIPVEAGLGGGSSNAATTLWALNALQGYPVSEQALQTWSAELGSDIPFFFSKGSAYCTGRGEQIREVSAIHRTFNIVKPEASLSTTAVYKALKLDECSSEDPEKLLECFLKGEDIFMNDLEAPAFRLCPQLMNFKKEPSFMSGSGTAFVCQGSTIQSTFRAPESWYPFPE